MTIKLVVMYTQPEDPAAFDQHYFGTHMPLVEQMPGLDRTDTARVVTALDGGEATFYRITNLYFADNDAMAASFGSAEGQATAADYQTIAPPGSRMFITAADE